MLDVRKLRALREVALRESFSEAAEHLGYTQSAISQQISQLERQVGTLLVDRRGRGIKLTAAGRALVECADVIMRRLTDAEAELEAITGVRHGSLRLTAFGDSAVTWMPAAIRRFRTRHPAVRISLTMADTPTGAGLVDSGEAEIAIVGMTDRARLTGAVAGIHLFDDPVRVALPSDHRLAGRSAIGIAELAEESWILPAGDSAVGDLFADLCARTGVQPRVAVRLDDRLAVHGLVASGLGVAFVPDTVARWPCAGTWSSARSRRRNRCAASSRSSGRVSNAPPPWRRWSRELQSSAASWRPARESSAPRRAVPAAEVSGEEPVSRAITVSNDSTHNSDPRTEGLQRCNSPGRPGWMNLFVRRPTIPVIHGLRGAKNRKGSRWRPRKSPASRATSSAACSPMSRTTRSCGFAGTRTTSSPRTPCATRARHSPTRCTTRTGSSIR